MGWRRWKHARRDSSSSRCERRPKTQTRAPKHTDATPPRGAPTHVPHMRPTCGATHAPDTLDASDADSFWFCVLAGLGTAGDSLQALPAREARHGERREELMPSRAQATEPSLVHTYMCTRDDDAFVTCLSVSLAVCVRVPGGLAQHMANFCVECPSPECRPSRLHRQIEIANTI